MEIDPLMVFRYIFWDAAFNCAASARIWLIASILEDWVLMVIIIFSIL